MSFTQPLREKNAPQSTLGHNEQVKTAKKVIRTFSTLLQMKTKLTNHFTSLTVEITQLAPPTKIVKGQLQILCRLVTLNHTTATSFSAFLMVRSRKMATSEVCGLVCETKYL